MTDAERERLEWLYGGLDKYPVPGWPICLIIVGLAALMGGVIVAIVWFG